MKVYDYQNEELDIINMYDLIDHNFWNIKLKELAPLRLNLRTHYLNEQNQRCCYCKMLKQEKHGLTWDVEHIVPKALFPLFLFEKYNLSLSCKECNDAKSDKPVFVDEKYDYKNYPIDKSKYSIIHPHFDKYSDHMEIRMMPSGQIFHIPKSNKGKKLFYHCDLVRFSMQSLNSENLDKTLLISFSRFIDNTPNLNHDIAKAYFSASIPQALSSEFIDS